MKFQKNSVPEKFWKKPEVPEKFWKNPPTHTLNQKFQNKGLLQQRGSGTLDSKYVHSTICACFQVYRLYIQMQDTSHKVSWKISQKLKHCFHFKTAKGNAVALR